MLILTKEEVNKKIDCFRNLIGIYNTKIDFLQRLLHYFEKNGQTVDCIVLNICVKGVAEEIFTSEDQIQILPQHTKVNGNMSPSMPSMEKVKVNCSNSQESISICPIKCNEIPFSTNMSHSNITRESVVSVQEQSETDIRHKDYSPNPFHPSLHIAFPNDTQQPVLLTLKSEPTVTNLMNNMNNSNFHHSILSERVKPVPGKCDSKRMNLVKLKKPSVNLEYRDQLNSKNIFLSSTTLDDLSQIHSTTKNDEICNSKNGSSKSTKLKQFKCEFCPSAFAQKGVLNRHKFLRHSPTVIKPHICPKCQKGFTLKHHLKNHLKCKSGCRYFS